MKQTKEWVELRQHHRERRHEIQTRLLDFFRVPASEYFYELAYCLLTPQSSAVNATKVIEELKRAEFETRDVNPEPILRSKEHYIRFHQTKSRHLLRLKETFEAIAEKLSEAIAPEELRGWLVKHVLGLGYKESTHFLRNIGRNGVLAILDRHILRQLHRLKVINEIPKSLTPKLYLQIEKQFQRFSLRIGIPVNELDLLFWSLATGAILK
jgi:N-glycosylase/DNA lyase